MSSLRSLARPYARAAFELANNSGQLAAFSKHLNLVSVLAESQEVLALLSSPNLSKAQKVAVLLPESEAADGTFGQFLGLLADNDRLSVLPHVAQLYEQHRAEAERRLVVRVRTADAIENEQMTRLQAALQARFKRTVELDVVIEPELLGGAILDAGDLVIDGSLRGKIARMRQQLVA